MSNYVWDYNESWFAAYPGWLDCSIREDATFCLCCYLFNNDKLGRGGGDAFTTKGFRIGKREVHAFDAKPMCSKIVRITMC